MRRFVKVFTALLIFEIVTTVLAGVLFYRKDIDLTLFLNKLSILFIFLFILSLFASYYITRREEEVYLSIESLINQIKDNKELKIRDTDDEVLYRIYSGIKRIYNILKSHQRKLSEEKEKLNLLIDNLKEGLILLDRRGNIKLMNPAAKNLLFLKKIEGNIFDLCKDYSILAALDDVLKTGNDAKVDAGGSILLLKVQRLAEDYVLLIEDVSKQERYQQMKAKFFEEASHELKTPITSIMGFSETLMDSKDMDEKTREKFLTYIYSSSKRLSELIEDILTLHRLEKGRIIKEGSCDLGEIKAELEAAFFKLSREKGLDLYVNCTERKVPFPCEYLRSILWNLTDNAVKFTDRGFVRVECATRDKSFVISVEDSGIGIDEKEKVFIFERFYTSKLSKDRKLSGTGLGLSIVKHIVEIYDGEINVDSTKGSGSKFEIILPIFTKS